MPTAATCSSIIPPAAIPKTEKSARRWRLRWSKAAFRVELISQEWALFWGPEGVNGGKLPFYYNNRGSLTDADTFYDQYFRTGTTKRCNYSNPAFDKIIDEEQMIPDPKKRIALLQQAGKILMEDVAVRTALQSRVHLRRGEESGVEDETRREGARLGYEDRLAQADQVDEKRALQAAQKKVSPEPNNSSRHWISQRGWRGSKLVGT